MTRNWQDFQDRYPQNSVTGTLKVLDEHYSPQLNNQRPIYVWLPPSYESESEKRYPVLYMQDGQNLFDTRLSYVGEWGVDESMTKLAAEGVEAIIVGVPNMGESRMNEYSPFDGYFGEGRAKQYIHYLLHTLKPAIDADFRSKSDPANTGIMGSSMGGLLSIYAVFETEGFAFAGALSPAILGDDSPIFDYIEQHDPPKIERLYMDVGTREGYNMVEKAQAQSFSAQYVARVRKLRDLLTAKGLDSRQRFLYVEDEGAVHREDAWARRLPRALRHLLLPTEGA